jgi:hypothetical protein
VGPGASSTCSCEAVELEEWTVVLTAEPAAVAVPEAVGSCPAWVWAPGGNWEEGELSGTVALPASLGRDAPPPLPLPTLLVGPS